MWKSHGRSTSKQHDAIVQLHDGNFVQLEMLLSGVVAEKTVFFATGLVCKSECLHSKFVYKLEVTEDKVIVNFDNVRSYKFIYNDFGVYVIVSRLPNFIEGD